MSKLTNGSMTVQRSVLLGALVAVAMLDGDLWTLRAVARIADVLNEFDEEVKSIEETINAPPA